MPRKDTRLESEGAEFLVLGNLLVEGMQAYKMYTNMPGYDVLVVNPEAKLQARVSVKSRWRASAPGFLINNFNSDFVVVVKLNRGVPNPLPPQFFVIPTETVQALRGGVSPAGWGKLNFSAIPGLENYKNAWHLIRDFIHAAPATEPHDAEEADVPESAAPTPQPPSPG